MDKINGHGGSVYDSHVNMPPPAKADTEMFSRLLLAENDTNDMPLPQQSETKTPLETALADGHLTDQEAIDHYRNGNGEAARVDASQLLIYQEKDFNKDNWAKGVVQGDDDFAVHGKVDLFKQPDGSIKIRGQEYDYVWEDKSALSRNLATAARGFMIGEGTEYKIEYYNSPKITREGNGYTEKLFGN